MGITTLLLMCACWQDPQPAAATGTLDLVELQNGEQLVGTIQTELDGYLEIRLDAGATIGLSRAQVRTIRRGAVPMPTTAAAVPARDEWFVLHDGDGAPVGWLHATTTVAADEVRVHEEYEFALGQRQYAVTSFAVADRDLQPRSCYFRERVREAVWMQLPDLPSAQRDRLASERIVEATVRGDELVVTRRTQDGSGERTLPWRGPATFPLLAREVARRDGLGGGGDRMVFDPATEDLLQRTFEAGRWRTVTLDGRSLRIVEYAEHGPAGRSAEWVDASAHTLRRELAGPSLVAVPSVADAVARVVAGGRRIEAARRTDPDGRFALWVPNPNWQAAEPTAGQIALRSPVHDASMVLAAIDHLDAGATLETAADAVARWLPLLHAGTHVDTRGPGRLRDRDTVRLLATAGEGERAFRTEVEVIPQGDRFLVFTCRCPARSWDELAADFAFARRSIEPDSAVVAAQGRPAAGAAAAAGATAPPGPPRELPHVRVLLDPPARQ